ncbi:MAG: guanylate kinase [Lachnospiraceae bacterium]|jgi:guanylate kinase|nr:guanylate kinase [Lachnospiraceae bacterium]
MGRRGVLAVVSGFSGAGKGTVTKRLAARYGQYALSVSATTREPRAGESEGVEYFFVSPRRFEEMRVAGDFLESATYVSHSYGTPRSYVLDQMAQGKDVILEIELQGAMQVKKQMPEAVLIFVLPPDARELARRLAGRGTEPKDVVKARLQRALEEAEEMDAYEYFVVNDDVEQCVSDVHTLIQSQHFRYIHNDELLDRLKGELRDVAEAL